MYKNHYNLLLLGRLKIPGCYNKIKTKYDEREEDCGQTFKHCWSQRWARETGDKRKDIGDVRHETGDMRQETGDRRRDPGYVRQNT